MLVPPSQGKASGGRRTVASGTFDGELGAPREQVIDALLKSEPRQAHIGNYYVAPLAEKVALATYRVTMGLVSTHRSSLWIFRDNRWQLLFHQGTVAT